MGIVELLLISVGLAMDAFAIAICKGLSMKRNKNCIIIGLWFGVFQAGMPILGYYLGRTFESFINSIDNLIAFVLLFFIGVNMLKEVLGGEENNIDGDISFKSMLGLAIATSIDALTIGIPFALFDINILLAASIIGIITFALSAFGVLIGTKFGNKYQKKAQILGGIILVSLAIKNLMEYFSII